MAMSCLLQPMRNTACKMRTLDPVWNESFEIPIDDFLNEEDNFDGDALLRVDVWNFLPADEKFR